MISSLTPSEKNCISGSLDRLSKASTASSHSVAGAVAGGAAVAPSTRCALSALGGGVSTSAPAAATSQTSTGSSTPAMR